jgi:hypothetical protein
MEKKFEKLKFKKLIFDKSVDTYFVYEHENVEEVKATTTLAAIRESNIESPTKVENILHLFFKNSILNQYLTSEPPSVSDKTDNNLPNSDDLAALTLDNNPPHNNKNSELNDTLTSQNTQQSSETSLEDGKEN